MQNSDMEVKNGAVSQSYEYGPGVSDIGVVDQNRFPSISARLIRLFLGMLAIVTGIYAGFMLTAAASGPILMAVMMTLAFAGGLLSTWSPCGYSSLSLLRPWGEHDNKQIVGWLPTLFAHGLGYVISGAILAGLLGLIGTTLFSGGFGGSALLVIGLVGTGYGLHCLGLMPMPYPQRKAQVPHKARYYMPMWQVGLLYGLILGSNFMTYVRTPIVYVVVALAVVSGSWLSAGLLIAALNLGRWSPLIINIAPLPDASVQRWLANNEERAVLADGVLLAITGTAFIVIGMA